MVKGRKEGRGLWTNGSAARVITCWPTACKTISKPGPKLVASPSNRQAVRTPGACQTPPCLQWARILQVYFRPCRTRVRAFLGRLRAKYVTKGFLMLKPGLAHLPARVHASKQRFLAGRIISSHAGQTRAMRGLDGQELRQHPKGR